MMADCFRQPPISPDLTVVVDGSHCIVLETPERRITVTDVDQLSRALATARNWVQVAESSTDHSMRGHPPGEAETDHSLRGHPQDLRTPVRQADPEQRPIAAQASTDHFRPYCPACGKAMGRIDDMWNCGECGYGYPVNKAIAR